jgi:hypothetical protein
LIATLDALAEVWLTVTARGVSPQHAVLDGAPSSTASPEGTDDGV